MKTIFELCQPRDEVLQGSLSDDLFAARLKDVIEKQGDSVYKDTSGSNAVSAISTPNFSATS